MTTNHMVAAVGHGSTAFWYLTRATGLVSLILLSGTVVLGMVASVGWTTARWPRFLSQAIHRNLSLLCLCLIVIHVVTTVADGYVPIGYVDAVVPFRTPYRPLWVGLGAVSLDLLLAVAVTSGLRRHIGAHAWRSVHWLAYLCWPIALIHGLGSGTDTPLPLVLFVETACTAAVLAAFAWRLLTGRTLPLGRRAAAGIGAVVITLAVAGFAALGPLRPHWSHRSGTSSALLAQLAAKSGATVAAAPPSTTPTTAPTTTAPSTGSAGGSSSGSGPSVPFTSQLTGSQSQTAPDAQGNIRITLAMHLQDASATPLTVVLTGQESGGGGVSLSSGTVIFGTSRGTVVGLDGGTVTMLVDDPGPVTLVTNLSIDQQSGALSGTVSGSAGGNR